MWSNVLNLNHRRSIDWVVLKYFSKLTSNSNYLANLGHVNLTAHFVINGGNACIRRT
jgi:hypothetical protein